MAKMGRPQIQIDQEQFEKLCAILCTLDDIAGWFKCSPDTIERWCKKQYQMTFADTLKRHSSQGKVSLRRKQYEVAMAGNVGMLIWLGKQNLGQSDKMDQAVKVDAKVDAKTEVVLEWADDTDG